MLCWPKGLSSRRRHVCVRRHNNDSIEVKVDYHWILWVLPDTESTKGDMVLAGMIDPEYKGEIELLFHKGGKEQYN